MQILIVDDDGDTLHAISETLEIQGHRTRCASNGQEALKQLRSGPAPCLILLDLMMPVMNGWQFRQAQLEDERLAAVPVVILTADGNAAQKAEALSAKGYLKKPLRPGELLDTVARFCGPRKTEAANV
jgi:CheY-like chemotaxis protein